MNQGSVSHSSTSQGFEFRSACRGRGRANARASARSLTAGHRQGPSDGYFKFRIGTASDGGKIDSGNAGNASYSRRVAPTTPAAAPDGAGFRAPRSKSAKTNLRHAHRLFSSDHQPAQHPRCPPACPTPLLNPSSGSMDMRALARLVKSPDLAVAIRATFSDHQE